VRLSIELDSATISFHSAGADEPYPWLIEVGALREAARAGNGQSTETANTTCAIDNAQNKAGRILEAAERRRATLYDDAGRVHFDGIIQSIAPGLRELVLTIEA
jgi:hypothetical protein